MSATDRQIERFISDLRNRLKRIDNFIGNSKGTAAAIDEDPYSWSFGTRSRFSVAIAQRMGLDDDECEKIRISINTRCGKIGIDDNVLKNLPR